MKSSFNAMQTRLRVCVCVCAHAVRVCVCVEMRANLNWCHLMKIYIYKIKNQEWNNGRYFFLGRCFCGSCSCLTAGRSVVCVSAGLMFSVTAFSSSRGRWKPCSLERSYCDTCVVELKFWPKHLFCRHLDLGQKKKKSRSFRKRIELKNRRKKFLEELWIFFVLHRICHYVFFIFRSIIFIIMSSDGPHLVRGPWFYQTVQWLMKWLELWVFFL